MRATIALLAAAALAPFAASAQTVWSNTYAANPVASTLTGGPWTLGTPSAPNNIVTTPTPAQTDYCLSGVENLNANPTASVMAPFYFPNVLGQGQHLIGFFDWRPSSLNEATMAASSSDGGKTWTWLQDALQLNASTVCPINNTPSAADAGLGHPFMMSFGGTNLLYLLDRRGGHVDSDGLVVKHLRPTLTAPLNAKPQLNATLVSGAPTSNTGIIAGWDFSNYATGYVFYNSAIPSNLLTTVTPSTNDLTPAANLFTPGHIVTASAVALGMANNYACLLNGTSIAGTGSYTNTDISSNTGSSTGTTNEWRIRGISDTSSAQATGGCNGWSLSAPQYSQGAQFNVDTTGVAKVLFQFDWDTTKQGVKNMQIQYTTDGSTWNNFGNVLTAVANGYYNQVTADFSNTAGTGNNPNFGVRLVSVYDPNLPAGSVTNTGSTSGSPPNEGIALSWNAGQQYGSAIPGLGGVDQVYNNNSGNWRFANVKFFDATQVVTNTSSNKTDYSVETTGLLNPDGILAVIPGSNPRRVLYVQKQLYSAAVACPTTLQPGSVKAPATVTGNKANPDLDVIRMASTHDGIHFTDLGAVSGLINGNDITPTGLRYAAPNGSIVKFQNGKIGLFFGAGNCQDGDSDGFHIIAYAESSDGGYTWTVVNGYNNPIAAVAFGSAPTTAPVVGASSLTDTGTNYWFGGRVYNPNAIYQDANHVSLIFAGYDVPYFSGGLASYRTIGQITLTSSLPLVP